MKHLLAALLLVVAPMQAQAQTPDEAHAWWVCMQLSLEAEKPFGGRSSVMAALDVTRPCRPLYRGPAGGDMDFTVRFIEMKADGIMVSPPMPLPPTDKRF